MISGRPLHMDGAHAPGWNQRAIGFAFVGDFMREPPTFSQLAVGAKHVAGLIRAFEMGGAGALLAHRDTKATACPGDAFPWDRFIELVADQL